MIYNVMVNIANIAVVFTTARVARRPIGASWVASDTLSRLDASTKARLAVKASILFLRSYTVRSNFIVCNHTLCIILRVVLIFCAE
ncbi:hypothetical protein Q1695_013936 [Nippostrongylus brasiliensis]|nr:hypothetical protein Q1695_013936 [Nippostrongylus brasiliensis]